MKVLFIGGTGTISSAISRLITTQGVELFLLNRGNRDEIPGATCLQGDIHDEAAIQSLLQGHAFDVVADFIAFEPSHIERDYRLFAGKTRQYIFISSASAYQKPSVDYLITESTPLANPYWQYSRDKAACEERLLSLWRSEGFPVTIVRPTHTYGIKNVPVALHGAGGSWAILRRMLEGKPVVLPGDGSSLWTFTHADDFARAFAGLLANPHAIGQAVHITSDEVLTWNQSHEIIAAQLGVPFRPLYAPSSLLAHAGNRYGYDFGGSLFGDKARSVVFDNSKIKRLVPGWNATIRYDQGMAQSVPYYLSHPELQKEDPTFDQFCDAVAAAMEKAFDQFS